MSAPIRISGITLNPKKRLRYAPTPIRGIGKNNIKPCLNRVWAIFNQEAELTNGAKIFADFETFQSSKLETLNEKLLVALRNYIEQNFLLESDLRRQVQANIKRVVDIGAWRGLRHKAGLPVRGQTTRTNSRTRRGNKRLSAVSGKKKSADKT